MSSVRMCDRCQSVFSELTNGWQTYQATTTFEDNEGRRQTRTVSMDACEDCALVPNTQRGVSFSLPPVDAPSKAAKPTAKR